MNQKKKVAKRINWVDETPQRREKRRAKKKSGAGRASRLRTNEKIKANDRFDQRYHLAIDFGHGQSMSQSELKDMAKQARRCYQHYRRSETEFQLHFLDFEGDKKFIQMMDEVRVQHFSNVSSWHFDGIISDRTRFYDSEIDYSF